MSRRPAARGGAVFDNQEAWTIRDFSTGQITRALGTGAAAAQDAERCAGLHNPALKGGLVSSAHVVPASGELPAYCEVRATARPAISIEVRLPLEGWNGK
jgi:feruloyl esterase